MSRYPDDGSSDAVHLEALDVLDAAFTWPDLTTFCGLDELGLAVTGQRLEPERAVLACRVVDGGDGSQGWCRRCGCEGTARDTVTRELAHAPLGWRPMTLMVTVRRYRCTGSGHVWRQDTTKAAAPRAKLSRRGLTSLAAGRRRVVISIAETLHAPYRRNMSDRFAGMTCVLCPNQSKGVGEHVWPLWFIQDFHGQGPFATNKAGVAYTKRDGVTPVTAVALPGVHVPMCEPCNSELNRSIEEPVKPVIRRLLPRSSNHAWPTITADEAAALARWFLKIGLLAGHPDAVHDNPQVQRDEGFPRFERVEPAWLDWMRTGSAPPADFSVYIAKRDVIGEQPWKGETQRITLPTRIMVGDRELGFATRSFGLRGLDVTMVWHPGWPILHPLEESGRVAALWPDPAPIDFTKLPEVHPREFSFTVGFGTRMMSEADFEAATQEPLSVTTDPFVQFFGD